MKNLRPVILLLGLLAGFGGCSEKVDPHPATYSQLLTGTTSKTWKMTTIQILEKGGQPESIPANAFGCAGDDLFVFYAGSEKRFQVTEGPRKCNPNDPDLIVENNWSLVNANATLSFVIPLLFDSPLPFIIKNLTQSQLSVEIYLGDEDDTSYRFVFTSTGG